MQADRFTSALGIQLGQTIDEVVERMGSCYRRLPTDNGTEVLLYERVDAPAAPADATADEPNFDSPSYYAEYEFDGDKLMRFRFGLRPGGRRRRRTVARRHRTPVLQGRTAASVVNRRTSALPAATVARCRGV